MQILSAINTSNACKYIAQLVNVNLIAQLRRCKLHIGPHILQQMEFNKLIANLFSDLCKLYGIDREMH